MAANNRIYFACQAAGIAQDGTTTYYPIHGLQTLGINTRFNLEQTFEIGQLTLYENVENIPDVEVTLEKYLDGWPLIYHLATLGAASATLAGRSAVKNILALSIYPDTNNAASGNPVSQCTCSGLFTQSLSYQVNIDGPAREAVTLVGNNKSWILSSFTFSPSVFGSDVPYQTGQSARRYNVVLQPANPTGTAFGTYYTRFPTDIPGISSSGTLNLTGGVYDAHVQSIRISANLGRDQLLEIGRRGPYFRFVNFPIEVRTDYDVYSLKGDLVNALEAATTNTSTQTITLKTTEGTYIDCGSQNRLSAVNYGGANAGARGGNAIMTFSYLTFNDMKVLHPMDPSGFSS